MCAWKGERQKTSSVVRILWCTLFHVFALRRTSLFECKPRESYNIEEGSQLLLLHLTEGSHLHVFHLLPLSRSQLVLFLHLVN